MEVQMKTYTVKLYEGVSREKVNETLKYYPDYFGKISIITNVINNKLQLTPLYTTNFTEPLSYQGSAFLKLPKFP